MKTEENKPEECHSCRAYRHKEENGLWESPESQNYWMLYGCTCAPEAEKDAEDWLKLIAD